MLKTEVLQMVSTATATSAGATFIDIPYAGNVVAINLDWSGVAGAATTGGYRASISRSAVDLGSTNNAKNELFGASFTAPISSGAIGSNAAQAGISTPVRAGERLYLNIVAVGVAPASSNLRAQLHVTY